MSIEIKKSKKPVKYEDALKFMEKRLLEIHQKKSNNLIWILEHEDLYTAGTSFSYLDSPSSTSSLTYKTQFKSNGGENFLTDNGSTATITLLEVSQ